MEKMSGPLGWIGLDRPIAQVRRGELDPAAHNNQDSCNLQTNSLSLRLI